MRLAGSGAAAVTLKADARSCEVRPRRAFWGMHAGTYTDMALGFAHCTLLWSVVVSDFDATQFGLKGHKKFPLDWIVALSGRRVNGRGSWSATEAAGTVFRQSGGGMRDEYWALGNLALPLSWQAKQNVELNLTKHRPLFRHIITAGR